MNDEPTDAEILRARELGHDEDRENASAVRYDTVHHALAIDLKSGATVWIPVGLVSPIAHLRSSVLATVELSPQGTALHWDEGDIDISVPGLVRSVTSSFSGQRRGGTAKTPAKTEAARENGKKGGRPRKSPAKA